jgi:hypothetical protein
MSKYTVIISDDCCPKNLANESLETLQLISLGQACILCTRRLNYDPRYSCGKCYSNYCLSCEYNCKRMQCRCVKCGDSFYSGHTIDFRTRKHIQGHDITYVRQHNETPDIKEPDLI